jgi:hypothetical protein
MSLAIIIDKSTFQALSTKEMILLQNYYLLNITPIMTMEIMADLKKEYEKSADPEKMVKDQANKLLSFHSVLNQHYRFLIAGELLNGAINTEYRPILGDTEIVETKDGTKGLHFKESVQEKAMTRWRDGKFLEAEKELADLWRRTTTQKDLLENLKEILKEKYRIKKKFESLIDLNDFIDELLNVSNVQSGLLQFIISEFNISYENVQKIFLRWEQSSSKKIKDFAPYSFHCLKVKLLFDLALRFDLVGTRATNLLDLEYLYYIPFCNIFSTNDNFQKELVPFLLDNKQKLICGDELKKDLKRLVEYRDTLSEPKDIKRTAKEPPRLYDSLTYKLWTEFFDWPPKYDIAYNEESFKKKMDEFIDAKKTSESKIDGEPSFIVKESYMRPTDYCPCGSGKQLKDCCLPPDYFEKHKTKHSG